MNETKPKKMVSRNVASALGIICVLLVTGLVGTMAYYIMTVNNKQSNIANLQTELNGNETLLYQTQINNTNLQNQNTNLQNQVNNLTDALNLGEYLLMVDNQTRLPVWAWSDTSISFGSNTWMFLYEPSFETVHQLYFNFPFPWVSIVSTQAETLSGQPILISVLSTVGQNMTEGRYLNATAGASYTWDGMEITVAIANPYYVVLEFKPSS